MDLVLSAEAEVQQAVNNDCVVGKHPLRLFVTRGAAAVRPGQMDFVVGMGLLERPVVVEGPGQLEAALTGMQTAVEIGKGYVTSVEVEWVVVGTQHLDRSLRDLWQEVLEAPEDSLAALRSKGPHPWMVQL